MNILLQHLEDWEKAKQKIFNDEGLKVEIQDEFDNEIGSRHIEINGNSLESRAVIWEDGFLELTALDEVSNEFVINTSCTVNETYELDEKLDMWLSEIAIYER